MDSLSQIGVFAAETFIIVFSILLIIMVIALLTAKAQLKPELEVELLHQKFKDLAGLLKAEVLSKSELKKEMKELKKEKKAEKKEETSGKKVYVIDFKGDVKASQTENLTTEINAILGIATPADEVVVRVESPGGAVPGYGLAASQLLRIRDREIPLTICVDKIAASGGYLMSVTANKILAAPFAILGSIGVVAEFPNLNRLLKKYDVDYKEYTAGDFKRTVSLLGEITPKGEEKFREQLESTHHLFKDFVAKFRPQLDLTKVATGEYWYGDQAIKMGLVDAIKTSDDYLMSLAKDHQIVKVKFEKKQSLQEKLSGVLGQSARKALVQIFDEMTLRRLP